MASTQSTDTEMNVSLKEHATRVIQVIDATLNMSKMLYEAKGNGTINAKNKKIKIGEEEYGFDTLREYASKLKNAVREFPRIAGREEAAKKAAKKAAKATRPHRPLPPIQYRTELVEFFKKADLGTSPNGKQKLQKDSALSLFFESGIGNLVFGVSLFNVWGNIQKLANGGTKVVMDTHARSSLRDSLEHLKSRCRDKLAAATTDKERDTANADLAALEAGEIQNKDYMCILSFYSVKENKDQLTPYTEQVTAMSEMTASLNVGYRQRIKDSRPKAVKAPKVTDESEAPPAPPAVPAVPAAAAKVGLPAIPTVGKSPAGPIAKRK